MIGGAPSARATGLVTFFSRDFGQACAGSRGRAAAPLALGRGARAIHARPTGVLRTGARGDLVRVDHFDVTAVRPALRGSSTPRASRRGSSSTWPARRGAGSAARAVRAARAGSRAIDVAAAGPGGRLLRRALSGRPRPPAAPRRLCRVRPRLPFPRAALDEAGLVCERCRPATDAVTVSPATVAAFARLRSVRWEDAVATPIGRAGPELRAVLDTQLSRLIGQPTRSGRFLRELRRLEPTSGERA